MTSSDLQTMGEEALAFPSRFCTVLIATSGRDGMPHISYAPYVRGEENDFYIYVSDTVQRTRNLQETGRASILFVDDETNTRNLFARKRLSFDCQATEIPYGTDRYELILSYFHESFGQHFKPLVELMDFHLFRLHPVRGLYVKGFGAAYVLEGKGLQHVRHLTGGGHIRRDTGELVTQ